MKTLKELGIGAVFALIITAVFVWSLRIEPKYEVSNDTTEVFEEKPEVIITDTEVVSTTYDPEELNADLIAEIESDDFEPLDIPLDAEIQKYLKEKSEENNIDWTFTLALIDTESNFKSDVVSHTGDYGLMQINRCNHEYLSAKTDVTDFTDPYQNIDAGLYMLRTLFEKYEEGELVLMAYHFGEGGAEKLWAQGKYTSKYSEHILQRQLEYQAMIEGE